MIIINLLNKLRGDVPQHVICKIFNVAQQTWSSWESGRNLPPPHKMQQIEDYFGLKKEKIFFDAFDYKNKLLVDLTTNNTEESTNEDLKGDVLNKANSY